jgi:hypothetical protein
MARTADWRIDLMRPRLSTSVSGRTENAVMQDRADPHARERALAVASQDPPSGVTPDEAVAGVRDVLASIGDTCPECPRLRPARAARNRSDSTVEQSEKSASCLLGVHGRERQAFRRTEPLSWQLHRDHPPPARPPSSATATPRRP